MEGRFVYMFWENAPLCSADYEYYLFSYLVYIMLCIFDAPQPVNISCVHYAPPHACSLLLPKQYAIGRQFDYNVCEKFMILRMNTKSVSDLFVPK